MIHIDLAHRILEQDGGSITIGSCRDGKVRARIDKKYQTFPQAWDVRAFLPHMTRVDVFLTIGDAICWVEKNFRGMGLEIQRKCYDHPKPTDPKQVGSPKLVAEPVKHLHELGLLEEDRYKRSCHHAFQGKTTEAIARIIKHMNETMVEVPSYRYSEHGNLVFKLSKEREFKMGKARKPSPIMSNIKVSDFGNRQRWKISESGKLEALLGKTPYGGKDMSRFQTLIEVAKKKDEFQTNNGVESAIVRDAMERHEEKQREAVSNEIVAVLEQVEATKTNCIANIRSARKQEKDAKTTMDLLDKCIDHANKTGNFCPALRLLGYYVPDANVPKKLQRQCTNF